MKTYSLISYTLFKHFDTGYRSLSCNVVALAASRWLQTADKWATRPQTNQMTLRYYSIGRR